MPSWTPTWSLPNFSAKLFACAAGTRNEKTSTSRKDTRWRILMFDAALVRRLSSTTVTMLGSVQKVVRVRQPLCAPVSTGHVAPDTRSVRCAKARQSKSDQSGLAGGGGMMASGYVKPGMTSTLANVQPACVQASKMHVAAPTPGMRRASATTHSAAVSCVPSVRLGRRERSCLHVSRSSSMYRRGAGLLML